MKVGMINNCIRTKNHKEDSQRLIWVTSFIEQSLLGAMERNGLNQKRKLSLVGKLVHLFDL
jgi:hypothetical protein